MNAIEKAEETLRLQHDEAVNADRLFWRARAIYLAEELLRRTSPEAGWIKVVDRIPESGLICFITDGREVALAESTRIHGDLWWDSVGCGGHDFEFNFTPLYWRAVTLSLPQLNSEKKDA